MPPSGTATRLGSTARWPASPTTRSTVTRIDFTHTEIDDRFEGQGVGSSLVRERPRRRTPPRRASREPPRARSSRPGSSATPTTRTCSPTEPATARSGLVASRAACRHNVAVSTKHAGLVRPSGDDISMTRCGMSDGRSFPAAGGSQGPPRVRCPRCAAGPRGTLRRSDGGRAGRLRAAALRAAARPAPSRGASPWPRPRSDPRAGRCRTCPSPVPSSSTAGPG